MRGLEENRWVPHRVGLVNYWHYDQEEFHFAQGKLLLRGGNGSGKSVTMQSFIPLLLDGNKSPERLDPFGSRARQIQDYLLGDENLDLDQRTGYLFMEFKRAQREQYLTIGIGLQARRYKGVDSWGFAITDGRRIGYDLELYTKGALERDQRAKIPISKRDLKELLGSGGILAAGQGEYMALVNQLVFGFNSLEEYDELIKLLIHLRSPKLSKDFKPSVLYEIMNSSLQSLSDEDLRPLTETIENMDQMRTQLEQLQVNRKAALRIRAQYDQYNRGILAHKAFRWQKSYDQKQYWQKTMLQKEQLLDRESIELANLGEEIAKLELERDALQIKGRELQEDDAFQLEERYQEGRQREEGLSQELVRKKTGLSRKQTREAQLEKERARLERAEADLEQRMLQTLNQLKSLAETAYFEDHAFNQGDLEKTRGEAFDFGPWQRDLGRYSQEIKGGREALEEEQRVLRRYNELLQEQDQCLLERDQARRREEETGDLLEQRRQEYLGAWADWQERNELFKLEAEQQYPLNQIILTYGQESSLTDLEQYLFPLFQSLDQKLLTASLQEKQKRKVLAEQRGEKARELKQWQEMVDAVPPRDEQIRATREQLRQGGIPFIPLYEAVDFKAELTQGERDQLEAILADLGILDALIVPESKRVQAQQILGQGADKILVANRNKKEGGPNLNSLLEAVPLSGELTAAVDQLLASFSLNRPEATYFAGKNGEYSWGLVRGRALQGKPSRFLGAEARRRFKAEQIALLEEELEALDQELGEIRKGLVSIGAQRRLLQEEFSSVPAAAGLDRAVEAHRQADQELTLKTARLEGQVALVQKQYGLLQEEKNKVREKTRKLSLPLKLSLYQEAEEALGRYEVLLAHLGGYCRQGLVLEERVISLTSILEELQGDLQDLSGELKALNRNLEAVRRLLLELESLRKRPEFQEIQREMERIIHRMDSIPEEIKAKATRKGLLEGRQVSLREDWTQAEQELIVIQDQLVKAEVALLAELELGFVPITSQGEAVELVPKILAFLKQEEAVDLDQSLLTRRLQEAVYEQRTDLLDFGLSIKELDPKGLKLGNRLEVTARLEGRVVSLYRLADWIEEEIANNQLLLDEADRELFEEIIMQTVGQKIRAKIYRAEEWVRNMNKLMATRDSSSGLTLYLQWRPKPPETEEELGTRELVHILKTDLSILSEDIFNQVTTHFRSQVARAKIRLEEQDFRQSFHQIIQNVLDYRQWFEFKLFFQKTGENRKELTNRAFDRLSGGEKAMSMYIPLFSSVFSRYDAARADCPRLISLDEAFAGVDDSNIRDMFLLLEQLGFDYIINSQILWGDYDTVSSLSICELVRPKNADHVAVIRYHWDGQRRSLVLNQAGISHERT